MNRLAHYVTPFLLGPLVINKPPGDGILETLLKDLCKESKLAWHHQASTFNYFSLIFLQILTIHAHTSFNATIQWKSINLHGPSLPLSQNEVKMFTQGELFWIFFNNYHFVQRKLANSWRIFKSILKRVHVNLFSFDRTWQYFSPTQLYPPNL